MRHTTLLVLLFVTACDGGSDSGGVAEPRGANPAWDAQSLGTVHFPTSCNQAANPHMQRGLALLHHMTYEEARRSFASAADADPECGMAYWGVAMTYVHPLWPDVIPNERLIEGWELATKARVVGDKTDRERGYIEAIEAYYRDCLERD